MLVDLLFKLSNIMKILSAKQIYQALEATVLSQNISELELLERAGNQVFNWIHKRMQGAQVKIHVFNGIGNNGGVGLVLARFLLEHGYNVNNYVINYSKKRTDGFLKNYERVKNLKQWPVLINEAQEFPKDIHPDDIIIDAIFGIGLNRDTGTLVNSLFKYLNTLNTFKLAIDIPSGLYSNKAPEDFNNVLFVNYTLSFQSPKLCFFLPETAQYTEQWEVLDIGLDQQFIATIPSSVLIGKYEVLPLYKTRNKFSNKSTYGHALIIGGSHGKLGAMLLSSKAAMVSGAGLVTALIPECGYTMMQTALPEAMVLTNNSKVLTDLSFDDKYNSIAVGMGMGTSDETLQAFSNFMRVNTKPLVIDADAINSLALQPKLLTFLPEYSILTPHKKELERLIGVWEHDFDMIKKVITFSTQYNVIVVVKDAITITVHKDQLLVNSTGNAALATAGSGDVLSGTIAGLVAQGYDMLHAAIFGVYLQGKTADLALPEIGFQSFIASNIIEYLPDAYMDLFKQPEQPKPQEGK